MEQCISYKNASVKTYKVLRFLLFCSILDAVYKLVQAVDGHSQAFIQTDRELRYLVDGISFQMQNPLSSESPAVSFTDLEDENLRTFASPIIFDPPALDFGIHPLGMPHMERVVVQNPSTETSVHLLSISGSTLHFHCSFFQEKIIPPGGNTSFDVVFLARQEGHIENTLFIHTSLGSFKYQVLALGIGNPYRLQPFLGVRMPLNSSYAPLIHMHNPHSATLQLTEMYTSGGDLHLELPNGDTESSKQLWEIPPYETKIIMRANFVARIERNHTAYIRIKTNSSFQEYLVVPIEVEVSSIPGIYSPTSILDFGVLRSHDEPRTLSISLFNSGQKHVHVVNVIVAPVNEAVDVKFLPIKIPPDTLHSTEVANITFIPSKITHQKQCSGKIVLKAKNNQFKLTIPYQVTFLQGSLEFNQNSTRFYTGQESKFNMTHIRQFNITNHFNITVVIYNTSLPPDAQAHFSVNFTLPHFLKSGETASLGWLIFTPPDDSSLPLSTHLTIHTNISHFHIPLVCFSGKLQLFLPQSRTQGHLDFGTPSVNEKRSLIFAVINENPVDVNLKHWGSNFTKSYVELVGLDKGNLSTLARRRKFSDLPKGLTLKPHHYAIFRVGITAPAEEGVYFGEAFIETLYEIIKLPFSLRTAKGSLITDDLFFDNAFPGKISSQPLYIRSTFSHPMTVTSVTPIPEDVRFLFEPSKVSATLQPENKSMVGKVFFDPRRECKNKCYSGLPTTSQMGHQWLLGMNLPSDIGETDGNLYRSLRDRWQTTVNTGERNMNITFQLDTSEVRGFYLRAHATLQWPRLSSKCHLRFPITQVGNVTVKDFALENPSSLPVLVQVVPLSLYPSPQAAVVALSHKLGGESVAFKHTDELDADVFTLQDLENHNPRSDNPIPAYRKSLEEYFSVQTNKQSIAMLLTPGMRVRVRIGFAPQDDVFRTSLILIRNNLTVLDALVVQGQGGRGQIRIGNKDPGSDASLMFELTEKHLKDCENSRSSRFLQPNFTVRRAFTARNTGELPVYIRGFDISGAACEGYGFRVLSCQGFELKPNSSRRVDIAYTPDFTLSRVEQTLSLHTSLGTHVIQYQLVATLPRHLLAKCSQALPRPSWEPLLYYSVVSLMIFLLFCVLTAAYFEGDRILKSSFYPIVTASVQIDGNHPEKGQMFDLKVVAKAAATEVRHRGTGTHSDKRNRENNHSSGDSTWLTFNNNIKTDKEDNHSEHSGNKFNNRKSRHRNSSDVSNSCSIDKEGEDHQLGKKTEAQQQAENRKWTDLIKNTFSFRNKKLVDPEWKSNNASTQTIKDNNITTEEKGENNKDVTGGESRVISSREKCAAFVSAHEAKLKQKLGGRHSQERIFNEGQTMKGSKKNSNLEAKQYDEETSSTTTESSNPESDISEKDPHRLPDVCMSAQTTKHLRSRVRSVSVDTECKINNTALLANIQEPMVTTKTNTKDPPLPEEGEFELTTKNKGHKKIKVDPSKVFGGDILRPSTLELPYKPKPVIMNNKAPIKTENLKLLNISKNNNSSSNSSASSTSSSISSGSRKNSNKSKGAHQTHDLRLNDHGKDSPPPLWDSPTSYRSPDETLHQIAQQTENFALRLSPPAPSPKLTRKPSLDGCISYSAVVSGENSKLVGTSSGTNSPLNVGGETTTSSSASRLNSKISTQTKMTKPAEIVKPNYVTRPNCLPVNPIKDTNIKMSNPKKVNSEPAWKAPQSSAANHKLSSNLHSTNNSSPFCNPAIPSAVVNEPSMMYMDTPDVDVNLTSPGGSLGGSEPFSFSSLRGPNTDRSNVVGHPGMKGVIGSNLRENRSSSSGDIDVSEIPSSWNLQQVSLMQIMRAERRQRLEEYYKQQALQNWPGFESSASSTMQQQSSFWDPNYMSSTDNWSNMGNNNLPQLSDDDEHDSKLMPDNPPVWSNPNPVDSLWGPANSVWQSFGNPLDKSPDLPDPLDLIKTIPPQQQDDSISGLDEICDEMVPESHYNSYQALSSIWSAPVVTPVVAPPAPIRDTNNVIGVGAVPSAPAPSAWSFSLFSHSNPAQPSLPNDLNMDAGTGKEKEKNNASTKDK